MAHVPILQPRARLSFFIGSVAYIVCRLGKILIHADLAPNVLQHRSSSTGLVDLRLMVSAAEQSALNLMPIQITAEFFPIQAVQAIGRGWQWAELASQDAVEGISLGARQRRQVGFRA